MTGTTPWRIASYNVHACIGTDGRFCPERIVDVLRAIDADIIGLQEVEDRPHEGRLVSDFISEKLNMHAYKGPTLMRGDAAYGNLLLSKTPADVIRTRELPIAGDEPRGAIEALIPNANSRLKVVTTHLGLSATARRRQIEAVLDAVSEDDADCRILLGDFNDWLPCSRVKRALKSHFGEQERHRTFPTALPMISLDRILTQPSRSIVMSGVMRTKVASVASDHLPVYADLAVA